MACSPAKCGCLILNVAGHMCPECPGFSNPNPAYWYITSWWNSWFSFAKKKKKFFFFFFFFFKSIESGRWPLPNLTGLSVFCSYSLLWAGLMKFVFSAQPCHQPVNHQIICAMELQRKTKSAKIRKTAVTCKLFMRFGMS